MGFFEGNPRDMGPELIGEVYRRLAVGCQTVNQLNRLNIGFENRMTPSEKLVLLNALEAERLSRSLKIYRGLLGSKKLGLLTRRMEALNKRLDLFEARQVWAGRLRKKSIAGASPAGEWARVPILPGVVLYRRVDIEASRLVVSFAGQAARMMVALPDYLTAIEPVKGDVLLVRTDSSGGYLRALPESLDGFETSFRILEGIIESLGYSDLKIVGTSGGVLPAMTSCAYLFPSSVLVVGPPHGHFSSFGEELVELLTKQPRLKSTRYVIAYGSNSKDKEAAKFLSDSLSGECIGIEGAGHAAMRELEEQFSLAQTLLSESGLK